MSIGTLFHKITHAVGNLFTAKNLTAGEKFVSDALPVIGADLSKLIDTLPDARTSIFAVAENAIKLWQDAKGQKISFSLGLHIAQAAFTAHIPEVVAEAEELIAAGKL